MEEHESTGEDASRDEHGKAREVLIILASLGVGALLLVGAYLYWAYDFGHPTTEDAYLRAHTVWITPQVTGQVIKVHVKDNQHVKAGTPIFDIDPRPFAAQLSAARSEQELVEQGIKVDQAAVVAAGASVSEQEAALNQARDAYHRIKVLVEKGDAPQVQGVQTRDAMLEAQATLANARAELKLVQEKLGPPEIQQARIDKARAAVDITALKTDWTVVTAPADGYVTQFDMRVGEVVSADQQLFPFIESNRWWVQANYKETKIANIKPGMVADVRIDIYGSRKFRGTVESTSSASAAQFTLLPPENTTGNWVKVTQRIPVRIRMEAEDPDFPYHMGASATVTVNTDASP
ncbi:MAG: HlyD family secretion protein [Pseudomonadota bacterium]|nr:HlyD family secretion protein [Pseudomonadota bacterium]